MKNLFSIIFATFSLFPLNALAHGTHIEEIDGHAHSFFDVALNYLMIAILLAVLITLFAVWRKNRG